MKTEKEIKEIMKRDLMPFPNKQDKLEYTEEDVILIAKSYANEKAEEVKKEILEKNEEASYYDSPSAKGFRNGLSSAINSIDKILP